MRVRPTYLLCLYLSLKDATAALTTTANKIENRGDDFLVSASKKQHLRSLQGAVACDDDIAQYLQNAASANQNLTAQGLVMVCQCGTTDEGDDDRSMISCGIDHGGECNTALCALGWNCRNPDDTAVEICSTNQEEQIWTITPDGNFNRRFVRNSRVYTTGVVNLKTREIEFNRVTGTCTYAVDGQQCTSCELCNNSNEVVADCDNVVPGAIAVCGSPIGMLFKLLELDSRA